MSDIIRLLPDAVASQIAAGEVIQRPASALKELLENAIDAGARRVQAIIKDAGKSLLQVVDDGCGMSENDARLCFERHATSKINAAADLFSIRTMGFRGEALASIAAIARVELKTRLTGEETGVLIEIEGSELKRQEATACTPGTSIAVRNLFYNTPARRNFLKSNAAETRHLVEAFQRIAIAHPGMAFSMLHDGSEVFRLGEGNLRQRIAGIFGNSYNERLVPIEEESTALKITGFIGKPQFAKKTRGEQFLFVNGRYVRDPYLNHAISGGMDELLQPGHHPSYFIFIGIDPARIDVNIHPSKTEVKFDDERLVYSVMKASVKRALGRFSVMPSLDFEKEPGFDIPLSKLKEIPRQPAVTVDRTYNPFAGERTGGTVSVKGWEKLFPAGAPAEKIPVSVPSRINFEASEAEHIASLPESCFSRFAHRYLIVHKADELLMARSRDVHERIFFEQLVRRSEGRQASQQSLFPQAIEFSPADFLLLKEMDDDIHNLGFDIREFGKNTFVVHGIPFGTEEVNTKRVLEEILEDCKHQAGAYRSDRPSAIARSVARSRAGLVRESLTPAEIRELMVELFRCERPNYSLDGGPLFIRITPADVERRFSDSNTA